MGGGVSVCVSQKSTHLDGWGCECMLMCVTKGYSFGWVGVGVYVTVCHKRVLIWMCGGVSMCLSQNGTH